MANFTIYLRTRERKNGIKALFLDISVDGRRTTEYLKLYLVPELTRADKAKNKETMRLAETIKAQRIMELQSRQYGAPAVDPSTILFYDFYRALLENKSGQTRCTWESCLKHLLAYDPNLNLTLKDITVQWVQGFRDYLDRTAERGGVRDHYILKEKKNLSNGTKAIMFHKLRAVLNFAVKQEIIARSPASSVSSFKTNESEREFLTLEELRKLTHTPPRNKEVGRAFFFSCLTGLRFSDIIKLKWGDVQSFEGATRIVFKQKKTGGLEYLDLNPQAVELLGTAGAHANFIFPQINQMPFLAKSVPAWVKAAGINKHITFHCARHTFAVMMLDLGVDLYTVSKLLGHKDISTTQIYAKILDKNKRAAVNKIPDIFEKG